MKPFLEKIAERTDDMRVSEIQVFTPLVFNGTKYLREIRDEFGF